MKRNKPEHSLETGAYYNKDEIEMSREAFGDPNAVSGVATLLRELRGGADERNWKKKLWIVELIWIKKL